MLSFSNYKQAFNNTSRYLDDILSSNLIKPTNTSDNEAALDLHLSISNDIVSAKI